MFLINFQLRARNRKIPGGGSFNIGELTALGPVFYSSFHVVFALFYI